MRKQFSKSKKTARFYDSDVRAAKIAYSKVKNKYLEKAFDPDEFTESDNEFLNKTSAEHHAEMH